MSSQGLTTQPIIKLLIDLNSQLEGVYVYYHVDDLFYEKSLEN
jgi:hypothetical protein